MNIPELLIQKYPTNEYVIMKEVSIGSGYMDYLLLNLWQSRGNALTGIELKSHRSDWLRELKKPQKAENGFIYCNYFYLLTTDESIAKLEEIPFTWGWLAVSKNGKQIQVKKKAPALEPVFPTRSLITAMVRRAADKTNYVALSSIQDKIKEAREAEVKSWKREKENLTDELKALHEQIQLFENIAGVKFLDRHNWGRWYFENPKIIGQAVNYLNQNGMDGIKSQLEQLKIKASKILENIETVLK